MNRKEQESHAKALRRREAKKKKERERVSNNNKEFKVWFLSHFLQVLRGGSRRNRRHRQLLTERTETQTKSEKEIRNEKNKIK